MAITTINESDLIKDSRTVINDNFTELNTTKAPLNSPALTGTPTAPTPNPGDDSTKLATTEYVQEEIRTHANLPVGFEYFSPNPNIPQGSLPLFGGEYSRDTYSALWEWVQEQTGYCKTEAEWQTLSSAQNGNVPYYSNGDGSTTFRVPSLKCWIKGANGTVTEVGSYLAAGLPNITGNFFLRRAGSSSTPYDVIFPLSNDSFARGSTKDMSAPLAFGSGTANSESITFSASRSNSIYGNSSTVQPKSIVGMWLVKAYGTIEDTGSIDEQQYIDDRIAAEVTRADGKYLPFSGGTLTGDIALHNTTSIARRDVTDSWTVLMGGSADNTGAYLSLYGKDSSSNNDAGRFVLKAQNSNGTKYLTGYGDGTLTWAGKEVERVNTIGTNYIRFEGGLQICWGYSTADTSGTTVTFPLAFRSTGYVVMVQVYGSSLSSGLSNKTTTSAKVYSSHATVQAGLDWIAVGLWK